MSVPPARPPVSVIVPFRGQTDDARAALDRLSRLALKPGDEVALVDNTPRGIVSSLPRPEAVTLIEARRLGSPYYARNVGARRSRNPWLLFMDADCRPHPALLDAYYGQPISASCGALAGAVVGAPEQTSLAARHARARARLDQAANLRHPYRPLAVTANLLVRRSAWEALGGFREEARSGADADFCWRLQEAGWELGYRPEAAVEHLHRERVAALLRQVARDGAGAAWLETRYPGCCPPPGLGEGILRSVAAALRWALAGDRERAGLRALDALVTSAYAAGRLLDNEVRGIERGRLRLRAPGCGT